jgi:hypothetical protein
VASTWLLLIYTVPSEPSRKRAYVWRELKKVGAVYLRDGVCALPHRDETLAAFRGIAERIGEDGGETTLVADARLDEERSRAIVARAGEDRAAEYGEIAREAERFLEHVRRETEHREFTFAELTALEADLGKLRRWTEQVRSRDYFEAEGREPVEGLLASCEEELTAFLEEASKGEERVQ